MQIHLHIKEAAAGGHTKARTPLHAFFFFFFFPINSLALLLLLKKEALNAALLLLLSHFTMKLDF